MSMFKRMSRRRGGLPALLAAFASLLVLAGAADAAAPKNWRTPDHAVYCHLTLKGDTIEGGVASRRTDLQCWTPNDGWSVSEGSRGRPRKTGSGGQFVGWRADVPVIAFGERWRRAGFNCVSRRTGLTCTNRDRHGWWLGRFVGYRLF